MSAVHNSSLLRYISFVLCLFLCSILTVSAADVEIDALVPGCGDGIVSGLEECDTGNLNGKSCPLVGFSGGTLACTASCVFDTTACTRSSGGGGGGGGSSPRFNSAHIALTGGGMPGGTINFLIDSVFVSSTTIDALGGFSTTLHTASAGSYRFEIYAVDTKNQRTDSTVFVLSVPSRGTIKVDNLFMSPSTRLDKQMVMRGDVLTVTGFGMPNAVIDAVISATGSVYRATSTTDALGAYTLIIKTEGMPDGAYSLTIRSSFSNVFGAESEDTFAVGDRNIVTVATDACTIKGDLNQDCRVNLTDFSVLLFWYQQVTLSPEFLRVEREKLSGDSKITIVDVSIMFTYWTG